MSFNNQNNFLLGVTFSLLLVMVVVFLDSLHTPNPHEHFLNKKNIPLEPNKIFSQIFLSHEDYLSGLDVRFRKLDHLRPHESIQLQLKDSTCTTLLHSDSFSWPEFTPHRFYTFRLDEPIVDSQNKLYCLEILLNSDRNYKNDKHSRISWLFQKGRPTVATTTLPTSLHTTPLLTHKTFSKNDGERYLIMRTRHNESITENVTSLYNHISLTLPDTVSLLLPYLALLFLLGTVYLLIFIMRCDS